MEVVDSDATAARRLQVQPAGTHESNSALGEAGVDGEGPVDGGVAGSERRRIDDDDVESFPLAQQTLHHLVSVAVEDAFVRGEYAEGEGHGDGSDQALASARIFSAFAFTWSMLPTR